MIIEVVIQPLFGTVYWNGTSFIYTPFDSSFTGNDFYTYKRTVNGVTTINTNNVNPSNLPPIANTIGLSADANIPITINIGQLAYDVTEPFGKLKITDVSGALYGALTNTDNSITYRPNYFNAIERISYTVSDGQFNATAYINLSTYNGYKIRQFSGTPLQRGIRLTNNTNGLSSNFKNWNSLTNILTANSANWDAVDYSKFVVFSNYIETNSAVLIGLYNNSANLSSLYNTVSANSAVWIKDRSYIDTIKDNYPNWDITYVTLSTLSGTFNTNITKLSSLSSVITNKTSSFNVLYNNVSTTNPNNTLNSLQSLSNTYTEASDVVLSSGYAGFWNNTYNVTTAFSSGYITNTNKYNTVNSIVSLLTGYENPITVLQSNSANWDSVTKQRYDDYSALVLTNSSTWISSANASNNLENSVFNLYNIWNGVNALDNKTIWNNAYTSITGISSTIISSVNKINTVMTVVTANSNYWSTDNEYTLVKNNSAAWNDAYTTLSSNSATWNSNTASFSSLSSPINSYINKTYALIDVFSSKAPTWDKTELTNIVNTGSAGWSSISSVSAMYVSQYTVLTAQSSTWLKDTTGILVGVNNSLTNSDGFVSMYTYLTANSANLNTQTTLLTTTTAAINGGTAHFNSISNYILNQQNNTNLQLLSSYTNYISTHKPIWNNSYDLMFGLSNGNAQDYYSMFADQSNYKTLASVIQIPPSTDYTLEGYIYTVNSTGYGLIFDCIISGSPGASSGSTRLGINNLVPIFYYAGSNSITSSITLASNTWNHIAATRKNGVITLWVNGVNAGQATDLALTQYKLFRDADLTKIGGGYVVSTVLQYYSDIRIVSGQSLYNSNFTPPNQSLTRYGYGNVLQSITGDVRLLFKPTSNSFYDASIYNYSLTTTGTPSSSRTNPYNVNFNKMYYSLNDKFVNTSSLTGGYYNTNPILTTFANVVASNSANWNNKPITTALSSNSGYWEGTRTLVQSNSSVWSFQNTAKYDTAYSIVTSQSATYNINSDTIETLSSVWLSSSNVVYPLTSQWIYGSPSQNISANNFTVYGDSHVFGNLSALGTGLRVNNTLQVLSSFTVSSNSTNTTVNIAKVNGFNGLFHLRNLNNSVFYIKTENRSIGINTNGIDFVPNNYLVVSGAISATGALYPHFSNLTATFVSNSAKWNGTYNYVTSNSANYINFIVVSYMYDYYVTIFQAQSSTWNNLIGPIRTNYYTWNSIVTSQSAKIVSTTNYISLCNSIFGTDTVYRTNSSIIESSKSLISTISSILFP